MALTHSPCVSLLAWPHRVKYDAAVTMSPIIAELGGGVTGNLDVYRYQCHKNVTCPSVIIRCHEV